MSESSSSIFASALARLRRRGAALGGGVLLTLPMTQACVDTAADTSATEAYDWAQYEGQRDTRMVAFTGEWSTSCAGQNTRFGCGSIAVHLNVRVAPRASANLEWKRVGVVYHAPDDSTEHTAIGNYSRTLAGGDEEWQVTVIVPSQLTIVVFDAWYQDGTGHTWVDDNQGELHVVNAGPAYNVVRAEPWLNTLALGETSVTGSISVQLADLDFDKQLELVATQDGWATTLRLGTGVTGDKNKFYWVEDFPFAPGRERWQIDLDLPGGTDHFEYAVVYRHGIVNGAKTYEFWDNNNGSNYHLERAVQ